MTTILMTVITVTCEAIVILILFRAVWMPAICD